jgi:D-aminopeptidase
MGAMIPGTKRIDARTLTFTAADYIEGFRALRAMINIAPAR